jgi:phage baseplate assembly protein W
MPRTQNQSDLDTPRAQITARTSIYSDVDLAFRAHPNTGDLTVLKDINSVKQSIRNLIMTSPGERPFSPDLGSGVRGLLFEPVNSFTALDLKEAITQVIENYESRVRLLNVSVIDDGDNNRYKVQIQFQIITSLDTGEADFYIERIR